MRFQTNIKIALAKSEKIWKRRRVQKSIAHGSSTFLEGGDTDLSPCNFATLEIRDACAAPQESENWVENSRHGITVAV